MLIERNYRKNPHTANFLMTFHTAGGSNLGGAVAEPDLLDEVPVDAPAYRPTERQRQFMADLLDDITTMNAELGRQGSIYTLGMSEHSKWTPENVRQWIDNLIAKRDELRKAAVKATSPVRVEDGRYAVEEDGVLKFFKVKNGRKPGFVFLDIQASDDLHAIRDRARISRILALIAADAHAAMVRYGREIGRCGRCNRTLTSEYRDLGLGPICIDK